MLVKVLIGAGAAVVASALVVIAYFFLYRIVRSIYRNVSGLFSYEGTSVAFIVGAWALTAALFPGTVTVLWRIAVFLLQFTLVNVPQFVFNTAGGVDECLSVDDQEEISECISKVGGSLIANFTTLVQVLFDQKFPEFSIVYTICFFGVAGIFLVLFRVAQRDETIGLPYFVEYFRNADVKFKTRVALSVILIATVYLSLCAIAAVSLFKPANIALLSRQEFENKLKLSKLDTGPNETASNAFKTRFPEKIVDFLTEDRKNQLKDAKSFSSLSSENDRFTLVWKQIRLDIESVQDRLLNSALADYELKNISRVGSREQALHFLNLERWYQSSLNRLFEHLDNCRNSILLFRLSAEAQLAKEMEAKQSGQPQGDSRPPSSAPSFLTRALGITAPEANVTIARREATEACRPRPKDFSEALPERGAFGTDLGPISSLAGWLLKTESIPLALIVGLVGFGLFGSLVSSFVRTDLNSLEASDIFALVIRGVSAAIVVFLAAYGGIAIVAQTPSDPNPYVVFVTCLAGAVFGEDVWLWARHRFVPKEDAEDSSTKS
jgi:hypothetical protein